MFTKMNRLALNLLKIMNLDLFLKSNPSLATYSSLKKSSNTILKTMNLAKNSVRSAQNIKDQSLINSMTNASCSQM